MRAADDATHTANINSFRTNSHPITQTYLSRLTPHSIADVINDSSWRVAPIIVTGNAKRMAISNVQSVQFGKLNNLQIFTWNQPLSVSSTLQASDQNKLYENITELTGWFVQGVPAHLTSNINPSKGLADGTHVILHSITLPQDANIATINSEIEGATPGSIISLHCTPTSVNVIIPNIKPK